MIKNGEFFMIQEMKQKGMNITQIAEELGRDRKTIRKWLANGIPSKYHRTVIQPSKLEPFKAYIRNRMDEGCLNAVVILDEIKFQGYDGKLTTLRNYMRPIRPIVATKASERYETLPGQQAQVDWGQFTVHWNGKAKRIYAFVMVLGYSRMMYLEFTEDEKLETLIGCHTRAMEYFGGRTDICLYDNMKTVVTGVDNKGEIVWNERFAKFASHHGFIIKRCRPYRPRTKGKVENGIGYVRKNFWPRIKTFTSLADLNAQARWWIDKVANIRMHGTTHEIPSDRWQKECLKPFNQIPFAQVDRHDRKVSNDAVICYEANRYSVPFKFIGSIVQIQDDKNGRIRIFSGDKIIAEHIKETGRNRLSVNKKHFEGIRTASFKQVPQPLPRLITNPAPEVAERDLSFYEQFSDEAVSIQ
ncbi:Integrase [uncultured Sporomusa sp.]|uniref:Integrase n=2 Tax=uncultured Sporomusa sp. TaxID=307249 RepID=A0A212M218_9FIRM|nr:Integrase [uncultured Sporomusa sp.]SCM81020.1 Integrase [uncultured Sporomusa sp.]SCM82303.1 Integrase [uncultured Sporomusa sp.]SCM82608.1 Integrase [uncultured Sporomusa sp.]SCM83729.1 Integrase [uncultured Sporomusa sp.]